MNLFSLRTLLRLKRHAETPAPAIKRNTRRESEIYKLVTRGKITLAEIAGNHKTKEMLRLRRLGYVYPNGHSSERWEVNTKTGCKFKVYKWTGKVPANWVSCNAYTGLERRKQQRGGK